MNEDDIDFPIGGSAQQYVAAIVKAIALTQSASNPQRRAIYDKFEEVQKQHFNGIDGSDLERDHYYRLLRAVIRSLENDIRNGVDIFADGYISPDLLIFEKRLDDRRTALAERAETQRRRAENAAEKPPELTANDIYRIEKSVTLMAMLTTTQQAGRQSRVRRFVAVVRAVLTYDLQLVAAEGVVYMIWLLIQPAVLLGIISALYMLVATRFILNMDVPTFALLGSATWIMCRQTILRVSGVFNTRRALYNLYEIRPLHAAVAQALVYFIIYFCVFLLLFGSGTLLGLFTAPAKPIQVMGYIVLMWMLAFSIGLIFGSIGVIWPVFLRFSTVLERILQMFSSVFFVSEQLPEEYKKYVLWSPTAHGMQKIREAYFKGYESTDSSSLYFISMVFIGVMIGLVAERAVVWRVQPS